MDRNAGTAVVSMHVLYDSEVRCRHDIDVMEDAIRNVRTTASSQSDRLACQSGAPWTPNRRCNLLETTAYMSMRLALLRSVACYESAQTQEGQDNERSQGEEVVCHIGAGISIRATFPLDTSEDDAACRQPPHVRIVWRLFESNGSLPHATPHLQKQPEDSISDDDDDPWASGGGQARAHGIPAQRPTSDRKRKLGA